MRRIFNRHEKNRLYLASNGRCSNCGCVLDDTWEADHIQPYSKGGETHLSNAQALCRKCNRTKGNKMLELRPFQREFITKALNAAQSGKRIIVGNIHPGSGKTLAALIAANELMRAGYIDTVVVVVPRRNLASQFEQDWNQEFRPLVDNAAMKGLHWRDNVAPLIRGDASGYVTTYQSLMADEMLHYQTLRGRRILLICDEASQLGVAMNEYGDSTKSADVVESISKLAQMIFVLSGTMTRADGQPLLFAYPDFYKEGYQDGLRTLKLEADVEADYLMGVKEGYLRPFEFVLHDGYVDWQSVGADAERLTLSELEAALYKVISQPQYWQGLIDRFADKLREQKSYVSHSMCGLVAAYNQPQAKEIYQYMRQKHNDLKAIVAVSEDGSEAHKNLETFRGGGYDVLITVNMAYIGFDHKPINVICPLTSYRTEAYLRQLFARGLRMMSGIDTEMQVCYGIVPDDIRMSQFVHMLRSESNHALVIKEDEIEQRRMGGDDSPRQIPLGYAIDADLTLTRAQGIDPTGDMSASEYEYIQSIKVKHQSAEPAHRLKAMFVDLMSVVNITAEPNQSIQPRHIPEKEKEYKARSKLQKLVGTVAYRMFDGDYQAVYTMLLKQGFKRNEECTVEELHAKTEWLNKYWRGQNG